ncbi:probable GTP-binding protein [Halalkalibacter wakoensis JCM 9140]|uniref:Probable GTP-binding protein n=1 Tax=Halalkalibacter wakoensis JCM 9140 TaxID=1236970 RepID=W4Q739_9BACI|nr:dynamin family protein [Halalkalibacter wakoensis]GAE27780.1 probable GTP-binding protein [Halalkalibacter wakoensis JCM 9140]
MSFSLDSFKQTRANIVLSFTQLSFLLKEMNLEKEYEKISGLKQQLQDEEFTVVVVGEFSRGKSTFINGLLGTRVLPSLVRPTTAVLNVITHNPTPSIHLHFQETNTSKSISEEQFKKLIAPKEPLEGDEESEQEYKQQVEFISQIKYAEIGYPLPFCENGVRIIDTPGVNDLDPAREQITNTIIPTSDAAIFILAATKILSESERSFLRDRLLANDIHKIFIVINFKDLLKSEEEIEKVMTYARTELEELLPNTKIFMVAAKEALNARRIANGEELTFRGQPVEPWPIANTGFIELERALAEFLQFDRGAVKMQKPIQQATKLIDQILKKQIAFEKKTLMNQVEGVQAKVDAFIPKIDHVRKVGQEADKNLNFALKKEALSLENWYQSELKKITATAFDVFEENRYRSTEQINREIEDTIAPLERKLHQQKSEKMKATVKMAIEKSSSNVNDEWLKLDYNLQQIWSEPEENLVPSTLSYQKESKPSIFDDLYEELDDAWDNSTSFLGKVAIGAGYAATVVANGVSWLWGLFTSGEDEKTKLRRDLTNQFSQTEKKKLGDFQKQWKAISKSASEQFKQTVQSHVQQAEDQLRTLKQNASLEKTEVLKKVEVVQRQEKKLIGTKEQLQSHYHGLSRKTEKVEV